MEWFYTITGFAVVCILCYERISAQQRELTEYQRPTQSRSDPARIGTATPQDRERATLIADCEVRRKGQAVVLAGILNSRGIACVPFMPDEED